MSAEIVNLASRRQPEAKLSPSHYRFELITKTLDMTEGRAAALLSAIATTRADIEELRDRVRKSRSKDRLEMLAELALLAMKIDGLLASGATLEDRP